MPCIAPNLTKQYITNLDLSPLTVMQSQGYSFSSSETRCRAYIVQRRFVLSDA
jgi:hypothetical protein